MAKKAKTEVARVYVDETTVKGAVLAALRLYTNPATGAGLQAGDLAIKTEGVLSDNGVNLGGRWIPDASIRRNVGALRKMGVQILTTPSSGYQLQQGQ